jgi:hypothetical protein
MSDDHREERAKSLLSNPLFNEAFDVLKQDLMDRWNASGSSELEARESIWLAMRLVETGHMNKVMSQQHPFI